MSVHDIAEQLVGLLHRRGNNSVNVLGTVASGTATLADPTEPGTGVDPATFNTVTLGGNITVQLPPPAVGKEVWVLATQDGTGSRLVTWTTPTGAVTWVGAAAPTLTTTAAHADLVKFTSIDGVNWIGKADLNVH